jgi:hypothetical protein
MKGIIIYLGQSGFLFHTLVITYLYRTRCGSIRTFLTTMILEINTNIYEVYITQQSYGKCTKGRKKIAQHIQIMTLFINVVI